MNPRSEFFQARRKSKEGATKTKVGLCAVCGNTFPQAELLPGAAVRDVFAREILRDHPGWSTQSFICRNDLTKYRVKYVHALLESEKGELSLLVRGPVLRKDNREKR